MVRYQSYGTPNGEYKPEQRAAIITAIHGDDIVDLMVCGPDGVFFPKNIPLGTNGGTWTWPPYTPSRPAENKQG